MTEQAIRYNERRAKAIDLLGGECIACGTYENLSFDHVKNDRLDARHQLSSLLLGKWDNVVAELKKCQLLCHSCHGKKTAVDNNRSIPPHGTASRYNNWGCRCDDCAIPGKAASRKHAQDYRKRQLLVA